MPAESKKKDAVVKEKPVKGSPLPAELKLAQEEAEAAQVKTDQDKNPIDKTGPDPEQQTTQTEDAEQEEVQQTADQPDELAELRQSLNDYGVQVSREMKAKLRFPSKEECVAMESLCNLYETLWRTDKSRF